MRIVPALICLAFLTTSVFAQDINGQSGNYDRHQAPAVVIDTVNGVSIATARKDSSNLRAWYLNDTLMVTGVVTTTNLQTGKTAYCIQDTSGGIYLYYGGSAIAFSIGDSVSVIGQIQQYHGLTEIVPWNASHIKLVKSNAVVPKPIHLTLGQFNNSAESYESMLVEVDTLYRSSGYWPAATKSSSIYVNDSAKFASVDSFQHKVFLPAQVYPSADSLQMYLTSASNIPGSADSLTAYPINLVGVVSQYSSSTTVYNNGYELEPRGSADIQSTHLIPVLTIAQARVENNWVPVHSVTGDTIAIYGVVTSPNIGALSGYSSYFIQDTTAGVDVYSPTLMNFNVGDSVFVAGTVDQYNGLEEMIPLVGDSLHFGLLKHNAALPRPKHMTLHDYARTRGFAESYEGQIVEIDTLYKVSGTWPASGSSASIYVTNLGRSDTAQLYINKNTDVSGSKEHLYPVNVVGVISQYGTDSTGYEIIPLDTTDIVKTPGVSTVVTIAQARSEHNWIPDYSITGDTLHVYGVVTTPNLGALSSYSSYFIQDATGGIDAYSPTLMTFKVGDSVSVIGTVLQFNGLTEFQPLAADSAHFGYLKHNAVIPTPALLSLHSLVRNSAYAESYEGRLIQLDSLYKASGTWPAAASSASIYLTDVNKSDTAQLFINKNTDVAGWKEPAYPINVVGVVSQYGSDSTGYEIIPPDTSDIVHLTIVDVKNKLSGIPADFYLHQNYPNPFNPTTTIEYGLPKDANVEISVYDILGQRVATLLAGNQRAGNHEIVFSADRFASGVYLYIMRAGDRVFKQKMLLLK